MRTQLSFSDPRLRPLFESRWSSPEALFEWAAAAGIEDVLADPAMLAMMSMPADELAEMAERLRRSATTLQELAAPGGREVDHIQARLGERLLRVAQREARRYLDQKALAELGLAPTPEERARRWAYARIDDPFLSELLQRLHAAWLEVRGQAPLRPATIFEWKVHDGDPPRLHLVAGLHGADPWKPPERHSLLLHLRGEAKLICSCTYPRCGHLAPVLDSILEAILEPGSELAAAIRRLLSAPAWMKSIRRLDAALGSIVAEAQPQVAEDSRLIWRLKQRSDRLPEIVPLRQRRLKNGNLSSGSVVSLRESFHSDVESDQDRRAMRLLQSLEFGWSPEPVREQLTKQALRELSGHPFLQLAGSPPRPLELHTAPLTLELLQGDDGSLSLVPSAAGTPLPIEALLPQLRSVSFDGVAVLFDEDRGGARCLLLEVDKRVRGLVLALGQEPASFPVEAAGELLERTARIGEFVSVRTPESLLGEEAEPTAQQVIRVEPIGPTILRIQLLARPAPGGRPVVPGEGLETAPGSIDGERIFVHRELREERRRALSLQRSLLLDEPHDAFTWVVQDDAALELVTLLGTFPENGDISVEWLAGRRRVTSVAEARHLKVRLNQQRDWLGLSGTLEIDGVEIQLVEALDAARRGARFVQASADTWIALGDELRTRLAAAADQTFAGRGGLEISLAAAPAIEALVEGGGELEAALELRDLLARIREAATIDFEVPQGITAALRPYQVEGFRWLARLASWGGGGCLADDMGLGKTLQTLALLVHRMEEGPALVVAPTSVCGGWVREAERFAPELRPLIYGSLPEAERDEALAALGPRDLLVVSYTFLARDRERLTGRAFATLVLDEAQAIKNAQTERAKSARAVQADVRIALTGTPLENHVGDLWSLYRVTVPGLLGSWEQFRQRFGLPIERDASSERRAALSRILRPFLLRRTKREVAAELPPRTELNELIELSRSERELYEQARIAAVARVKGLAGSLPPEKARFEVLAAITRLRLASCHPRLYDPESAIPSSKLARVVELLLELREEGHRALVFSQFTRHLALVREAVEAAGLSALYLDGQTPGIQRQELVDTFQRGGADLFLISLKAGGVGLNLTGADFVLHLDPWWNPAVEDQASDRAHRIGQTRPVTVVRLISRHTIEEQILSLHAQKRELVATILDGSDRAGTLDTGALIELIETAMSDEAIDAELEDGPPALGAPRSWAEAAD